MPRPPRRDPRPHRPPREPSADERAQILEVMAGMQFAFLALHDIVEFTLDGHMQDFATWMSAHYAETYPDGVKLDVVDANLNEVHAFLVSLLRQMGMEAS